MHGDGFVVEGQQSDLDWVRDVLAAKYLLKVRGTLGPEPCDQKRIVILGRVVDWRADELWWEADPRHVEKILEACGMSSGNSAVVPGGKLQEEDGDDQQLAGEDLAKYRSVTATANFIAQDRPECEVRGQGTLSRYGKANSWKLAQNEKVGEVPQRAAEGRTEN